MALGRSYEQIDEMTSFDLRLLFDYWREHPTADDILKAVHGVNTKTRSPAATPESSGMSIEALRRQFPDGIMRG